MKISDLCVLLCSVAALSLAACAGAEPGILPARVGAPPEAELTLVWVGFGEATRFEDGAWVRRPEFDYEFTVEQRRYAHHWESVKHMRRRHPSYDGSAGPRELTYYFSLDFGAPVGDGTVPVQIASTLGPGDGRADRDFRSASLTLQADVSSFAPFDTYRIEQTYAYERGALEETVSLDKGDRPWVRNTERATLFAAHTFDAPPTKL